MSTAQEKINESRYGELTVAELKSEYADRISLRRTDQSYGIQNAMGDAVLDAICAELERRGEVVSPFRGG